MRERNRTDSVDSKNVEKNKEQWIKIAEGGDGYNTTWYDEFAPVMQQIERYLYAIDEHQLDLNWEGICNSVPALHDKGWHLIKRPAMGRVHGVPRILYGWFPA
jgi:hypothetical protein